MVPSAANDPARLQRLVEALLHLGEDETTEEVLDHLLDLARDLTGARYAALGVLNSARTALADFIVRGLEPDQIDRLGTPPVGRGVLGTVIADARPLRLMDLMAHPDFSGFPPGHPPMEAFLGVPVVAHGAVFGNLYLTDPVHGGSFDDQDEAIATTLAVAAALSIERRVAFEGEQRASIAEDRDRIARDLHDSVIQRLFGAGLGLKVALRSIPDPDASAQVTAVVAELDGAMAELRTAIFELERTMADRGPRASLVELCGELTAVLGFRPALSTHGPLDTALTPRLVDHLVAVVRESVTNVAKHAQASSVAVSVVVDEQYLTVEVLDDGIGLPAERPQGGHGLANLARRAERLGGSCSISAVTPSGTLVSWTVPTTPRTPADEAG